VPATYRGWTDGKEMLLTVTVNGQAEEPGTFSLALDRAPKLDRCQ